MTVPCPLCDFDVTNRLFESRDRVHGLPGVFTIIRCSRCSAVFIHPWLTDDDLSTYYSDHYGRYRHSRSLEKKLHWGPPVYLRKLLSLSYAEWEKYFLAQEMGRLSSLICNGQGRYSLPRGGEAFGRGLCRGGPISTGSGSGGGMLLV